MKLSERIKSFVLSDKCMPAVFAGLTVLFIVLFLFFSTNVKAHGWHGGYHGGWGGRGGHVYVGPRVGPAIVGGVVAGAIVYDSLHPYGYYPYSYGSYYVDPSWVVVQVQEYNPYCNCYVLVNHYQDRWGNLHPYP